MANKNLFVAKKNVAPIANATNNAGGSAYSLSAKIDLANLCCTGCFNNTFYVSAQQQLAHVKELCVKIDDYEFLCKLAIYSRTNAYMKDMPSFLLAYLCANTNNNPERQLMFKKTFFAICDNIKMVRNFVQIIRSGVVGRNSFGTMPKRLINAWLDSKSDDALFKMSVGNDPSLSDIIKLTHPKPTTDVRNALYGYLTGNKYNAELLPNLVKEFEAFKTTVDQNKIPNVSFEMLTALPLTEDCWKQIAMNCSWTQTRMNLNTFDRHGVFNDNKIVNAIVEKLTNSELICASKVFPYQLLAAYLKLQNNSNIPSKIKVALQQAMEIAVSNVPKIDDDVLIFVDTSGSMNSPITGDRGGATSVIDCISVASLIASIFLKVNPSRTTIIPFATAVHLKQLNPLDSIMTNTQLLKSLGGGGTNCSAPMTYVNGKNIKANLVIYCSDNESWMDTTGRNSAKATRTMEEWLKFKKSNPQAKLVTIDLAPNSTSQMSPNKDILQIGGFSDVVFDAIGAFYNNKTNDPEYWLKYIDSAIQL